MSFTDDAIVAAAAVAQQEARKTARKVADEVAREVTAPVVDQVREAGAETARTVALEVAERVAAEAARPVADETVRALVPDALSDWLTLNPPEAGPVGAQGNDGDVGPAGEPGIVWRGPYNHRKTYQAREAVSFDGSSYVARETTDVAPPRAPWDLLAKKGDTGAPGRSGGGGGSSGPGGSGGPTTASDVSLSPTVAGASDVQAGMEAIGLGLTAENPVQLADCQHSLWSDFRGVVQTLDNYTYDNGTLGVGSTMTANQNGALVVDANAQSSKPGVAPELGDRIAVADAANERWGIFTVTALGDVDNPWVLTRATDCDTQATFVRYWTVNITGTGELGDLQPSRFRSVGVETDESLDSFSGNGNHFNLESVYGEARGKGAMAIGVEPVAYGYCANAIGATAAALGAYAWAIDNAYALGDRAIASGSGYAVGNNATASGVNAMSVGSTANSTDNRLAIDHFANNPGEGVYLVPTGGQLFLPNLPTSDPGVIGQVYSLAGVLMVSAGPP